MEAQPRPQAWAARQVAGGWVPAPIGKPGL